MLKNLILGGIIGRCLGSFVASKEENREKRQRLDLYNTAKEIVHNKYIKKELITSGTLQEALRKEGFDLEVRQVVPLLVKMDKEHYAHKRLDDEAMPGEWTM